MKNKKALWFSRHYPTNDQLTEILEMGYDLEIDVGITEGSKNLTKENLASYIKNFRKLLETYTVVFGVFPPKLRSEILKNGEKCQLWEAWNETRTVEGSKPTFKHLQFCLTYSNTILSDLFKF